MSLAWQPQNEDFKEATAALHRREAKLTHSQLVARRGLTVLILFLLATLVVLGSFHWLLGKILGAFE